MRHILFNICIQLSVVEKMNSMKTLSSYHRKLPLCVMQMQNFNDNRSEHSFIFSLCITFVNLQVTYPLYR